MGAKKLWILSDAHIGHEENGKDGAEWLETAVEDMRSVGVDYVIFLGDMSHSGRKEQLEAYKSLKKRLKAELWIEFPGNHDSKAVSSGAYHEVLETPYYWRVDIGTITMLSLPAERGNAAGLFVPEVAAWLTEQIGQPRSVDVIICAHQFPANTVYRTERPSRKLHPERDVEAFLERCGGKIRAWFGGHIHSGPRNERYAVKKNGILFVNTGSVSHLYGTQASSSYLLSLEEGNNGITALYREHDSRTFKPEYTVHIPLSQPYRWDSPRLERFPLEIPARYRKMEEEVIEELP